MTWDLYPGQTFNEHRDAWDMVNAMGSHTPLLDSRFILPLLSHFGTGSETLASYEGQDGTRAMTILQRPKAGLWSTMQPSQAPLGTWVSNGATGLDLLAIELLDALPGVPLLLGITQQDPALAARPSDKPQVRTLDYIRTARIKVEGSFDEYWAGRGKNLRQNLKRQHNRLTRDGVTTKLDVITEPGEIQAAVTEYGHIESNGWKTATGTAIHPDNIQGRFYTEMLQNFARSGECRIYRYCYNGQVVAMDLCISSGGSLIILKTTYDESQTTSSPAMLMRQEAFRRIYDEGGIQAIEFYGKLMDWHTKWSSDIRTLYHLNCYRWGMLARLHRPSSGAPE